MRTPVYLSKEEIQLLLARTKFERPVKPLSEKELSALIENLEEELARFPAEQDGEEWVSTKGAE